MNGSYEKAARLIAEQQAKLDESSPAYCVGEQLRAMAMESAKAAELLAVDLEKPGMGIAEAEKKLRAYADELHGRKKCSSVCITPTEADRILREFYGIPRGEPAGPAEPVRAAGMIDLSDFF